MLRLNKTDHSDTAARKHVVELVDQQVLPSGVESLTISRDHVMSTHLFGILVIGISQTGHSSSILGFSHQDLALSITSLDRAVRRVCSSLRVSSSSHARSYVKFEV